LPYSCNCGWSAPLPARWGSSVLITVLSPPKLAQSTTDLLWVVGLSTHPCPQSLLLVPFNSLRVWLLASPCSLRQVQCFPNCHC
jgi:hypothetical protein